MILIAMALAAFIAGMLTQRKLVTWRASRVPSTKRALRRAARCKTDLSRVLGRDRVVHLNARSR